MVVNVLHGLFELQSAGELIERLRIFFEFSNCLVLQLHKLRLKLSPARTNRRQLVLTLLNNELVGARHPHLKLLLNNVVVIARRDVAALF